MIDLSGNWRLRAEFLDVTDANFAQVEGRPEGEFRVNERTGPVKHMPTPFGWIDAPVPCDVSTALMNAGLLPEPLEGTNSDGFLWLDTLSWWFTREFDVPAPALESEEVRLFIETLDFNAAVILNGVQLGCHRNAFRPFTIDVKRHLRVGANRLTVRLTTGYELRHPNDSLTFFNNSTFGQRAYLRKAQFTHGWDWCKPLPTCGIGGRVCIQGVSGAEITAFRCDTASIAEGAAHMEAYFEINNLSKCTADDAVLCFTLSRDGKTVFSLEKPLYLAGGLNFFTECFELSGPALWWPNGSGAQPLYRAEASVVCRGVETSMKPRDIGVRTVEIDMNKLPDGTRRFDFVVNGKRIFMKGGNWVPADSVYLRIPQEKYTTLVTEAAACNFNMLRIWGGGLYEPDCFYDACSQKGILLMHDFMYACAFYPDYDPVFVHEAELEAEYQTRRLAHQSCMAVWTGNNEVHESYTDWFPPAIAPERYHGVGIFNELLPKVVRSNSPRIPYMPSSPFYGTSANDMHAGDSHIWGWTGRGDTKFQFIYELEAFDRIASHVRFSSEYGFYGAIRKSSVERFHAGVPVSRDGAVWIHHGERQSKHRLIDPMLRRHAADPEGLGVDDYLLYTGIAQGMLYEELALALRRREHCSGKLIWMYNDCWPETGWTVIDYYLTRKISFYYLKRAFAPLRCIVRAIDGRKSVVFANDSEREYRARIETGYMDFFGNKSDVESLDIFVPAFGRLVLPETPATRDAMAGVYFVRSEDGVIAETSLRGYYRDYAFPAAQLIVTRVLEQGATRVTVTSDAFVPVVEVSVADDRTHMSDNYFPLLPGNAKEVMIEGEHQEVLVRAVPFKASVPPISMP